MKNYFRALGFVLCSLPVWAADPFSLTNPAHNLDGKRAAYADGAAFMANDLTPLRNIDTDWSRDYSPRSGTNLAVVSSRIELGVEWQGFRLGTISRNEWLAEAQRDIADIVRADRQKTNYDLRRTYDLGYALRGFSADGLKLSKAFSHAVKENWTLDWGVAVSALRGKRVRMETIAGSATATGGRNYTATVDWTRDYSHTDTIAEGYAAAFQAGTPAGRGYAIDLGLSLGRDDGLRLDWTWADAVGRMRWNDIPEKTLSGTTAIAGTFPGGRKVRVELEDRLMSKHALVLSMPINQAHLELADTYAKGYHFPRLGVRQRYGNDWATRLDYDFRFKTVGVALMHRWFYLNLQSDSLRFSQAKALGLGLGVRIEF